MNQEFRPGTGMSADPTSAVEISISCHHLLNKDALSRSDPMCVVYKQCGWELNQWEEIIRTEVVYDNLNPEFAVKAHIDYKFEEEQPLKFAIYDYDKNSNKLEDHDFLGFVETPLARIVAAGYHGLVLPLQHDGLQYCANQNRIHHHQHQHQNQNQPALAKKKSYGNIILHAEELVQLKEEITLELSGHSMGSSFLGFGCCSPKLFHTISKMNEGGKAILVYKSELVSGPHPHWKPLHIGINNLCNGDKDRGLKIEFFKQGYNGYHTSIGIVNASVNKLIAIASGAEGDKFYLSVPKGKKLRSYLKVTHCKLTPVHTFIDYIRGGTEIHCVFAIDLTGSNGSPADPNSLHHIDPADLVQLGNPYQQAIHSVGEIIQEYDHTKMFASYGFGAQIPPFGLVSHKFNLNLQSASPYCYGIHGVLDAYRNCINQVQLFGPTNFAPIIRAAAAMALLDAKGPHYYVLLIITDGIVCDEDETTQAIVEASTLPLSIIIVGVGDANFHAMNVFDGDTVRLSYNGKHAARDIVQFVPYRDAYSWLSAVAPSVASQYFRVGKDPTQATQVAKAKLAKEVLAEIPAQLTSYMKSQNKVPGNVRSGDC